MAASISLCPHCKSDKTHLKFFNPDYISGEVFAIESCQSCGLAWTALPKDFSDLSKYYGETYYGKKGSRFVGPMELLVRFFRQLRVDAMTRDFSSPGSALDIGCGRALTLALLKQRGWKVTGTEFSQDLANAAREAYDIEVSVQPSLKECNFDAASFDLISMYHVLEHVQNPFETLAEIRRILRPNGIFFVEVPDVSSWQARLGQGKWFHLDTPRHLWHFDQHSLINLLKENGFEILSQSTHSLEYGYYGFWQTLLNRLTKNMNAVYSLLKRHRPLTDDLLISAVSAIPAAVIAFPAELIAVITGHGAVIRIAARSAHSK